MKDKLVTFDEIEVNDILAWKGVPCPLRVQWKDNETRRIGLIDDGAGIKQKFGFSAEEFNQREFWKVRSLSLEDTGDLAKICDSCGGVATHRMREVDDWSGEIQMIPMCNECDPPKVA